VVLRQQTGRQSALATRQQAFPELRPLLIASCMQTLVCWFVPVVASYFSFATFSTLLDTVSNVRIVAMFVTVDCRNIVHSVYVCVCVCVCVWCVCVCVVCVVCVCVCVHCTLYIHTKCHLSSFSVSLTVDIEPQATELVSLSDVAEPLLDATALNMLDVISAMSIMSCPLCHVHNVMSIVPCP